MFTFLTQDDSPQEGNTQEGNTQEGNTQSDNTLDESPQSPSTYAGQPLTFSQLIPTATVDDSPTLKKVLVPKIQIVLNV